MTFLRAGAGLTPVFPSPAEAPGIAEVTTEEAAVQTPLGQTLRVTPLVNEGDAVQRGGAVACLRHAPDVCFVAPIAGRVARISLMPGRKLTEIVLFREDACGIRRLAIPASDDPAGLRRLMQAAGVWPWIRRRPFGGMPDPDETPAAIFVMAIDTRPFAPDPIQALEGRTEAFRRGLAALEHLAKGAIFVCRPADASGLETEAALDGVRWLRSGPRHPQGCPGIPIHRDAPAGFDAPVWDIHAEDVAALGALLETGELPMTRLVRIAGAALREARTLRTHPGADLRQLTQRIVQPGPHVLWSGSHLDGRPARWLGQRHRQVTVLPRPAPPPRVHWIAAALSATAGASPVIPTAALSQSLGAAMPSAPLIRAIGAGDDEAAIRLGVLSLLEDDLALADYVLGAGGALKTQLRSMLDRIRTDFAA